ncbi:PREDICTED: vomeronasal type-1 receptor 1-like [Dipodomys ordii]|uniref:Vomeronasal type-1 receptor n=1 Tax=Dipodomys ordii TaxID=10020 RepID=A0A1S3G519_DIPOR|nr:PREDICTED: vomeronasal type-1 receptor 1-like [Dipodomys ordii]
MSSFLTQTNMEMGVVFLTQTATRILGNSSLFCFYSYTLLTGQKIRPIDAICHYLVFANNLVILSRGIPQTMAGFGWKYFLDESGCKVVLYFHRVARGVSLNATCLLSGFQVSKLCTRNACWKITSTFPKCFGFCGSLSWILQLLLNVSVPLRVTGPRHKQSVTLHMHYRYCSTGATPPKPFEARTVPSGHVSVPGYMFLSTQIYVLISRDTCATQLLHLHGVPVVPFECSQPSHAIPDILFN